MTTTATQVGTAFAAAVVARDFGAARELLHPEIDFRAMTPNRIWEADGPPEVETVFRGWLADPDEEIHEVEATGPVATEDTLRVGWLVRGSDAEGTFVYEQQAYVREREGKVGWLRVICSGTRRPAGA